MPLPRHVPLKRRLYLLRAHAHKLEHYLLVLVPVLLVKQLFERPVLLFEQLDLDLTGLPLLTLLLLEGLDVK
jgi:hypothetical protein